MIVQCRGKEAHDQAQQRELGKAEGKLEMLEATQQAAPTPAQSFMVGAAIRWWGVGVITTAFFRPI